MMTNAQARAASSVFPHRITGLNETADTGELSGRRILIVEDEPLLAFELMDELALRGARPTGPAQTVEEAMGAIRSEPRVDAAVLNVFLRGSFTLPAAESLAARGVPFLFVTGDDAYVHKHFPDVPCHPKPADMGKIVAWLQRMLPDLKRS